MYDEFDSYQVAFVQLKMSRFDIGKLIDDGVNIIELKDDIVTISGEDFIKIKWGSVDCYENNRCYKCRLQRKWREDDSKLR